MEFKNLKQLMAYLADDDRCREYYAQLRWGGCLTVILVDDELCVQIHFLWQL